MILVASISLAFALLPALIYWLNRRHYRPPAESHQPLPAISVLIPARNESRSIRNAVESVLASRGVDLELVVLDDHSEDDTASIVRELAARDRRVRLETAPPLPSGWCGKQHACYQLSQLARNPIFAFLDADVRLAPDGLARMTQFLLDSKAALVSGFPRQETKTLFEKLLIPLIHFILLGFLPIGRMRRDNRPGMGAGCGQFFVAHREEYEFRHSSQNATSLFGKVGRFRQGNWVFR
jgi:cellulose synthase/poly-beta-1,6-N-acetylglucosamine synthase-like glycosyltransferase